MPSINMIANRRAEKKRQETEYPQAGLRHQRGNRMRPGRHQCPDLHMVNVRGQVADLGGQIQKLEPKVNAIDDLEKQTQTLTPKVVTLDGAKADTLFWYSNLSAITGSLPQNAWLTSLAAAGTGGAPGSASGTDPTVLLSGQSLNQSQVGEAMLRMNQSPGLDHIDLAFVQQQKTADQTTVAFQMTVHLKPEPSALAGANDAKKS